ncbi:MAG: AAA family ATPase [Hahellaceae bacterium]|nr:AAA family ATPase [Hahellaceae bacterium]MCP5169615.1 AAA family ATPase [Hahellaceae bacterium]
MLSRVPGYRIKEMLFESEHTAVARAERESDQQPVILKQLTNDFPDAATLTRFVFGFDVAQTFDHPNIVRHIEGVGLPRRDENSGITFPGECKPTQVLEDQQCMDLYAYLKQCDQGRVPLDVFVNMAVQLADALSVIHYHQVVHKDLHPGNILYNPDTGRVQITDFGLASLLSREQPALRPPEHLEGVLAYLSPEQTGRMNRALDYRSDFYSLGCTFYHLLSGHPPFEASDALGLVHAHLAKQPRSLLALRDDLPPVVSAIVHKLMMKTAEDRYQSALGLKKDLEKIREALASHAPVMEFPLGMDDISDRFHLPQKLYGRENEVQRLLQRFFQAAGGRPRFLAIAGYSGIGKSALVNEVHKPIAAYHGFFCAGKFDPLQKNIPYSALQTALKSWIQHTLSQHEHSLQSTRTQLLEALGANARVLVDFMPEFASLLGELPPVVSLGADETQNRFYLVFQQFIKVITREHPLVLFIDDIQWADRGTLNLLPRLMSEAPCRVLLIVAYRDNEVDAMHPALEALQQIDPTVLEKDSPACITLGPLCAADVMNLLTDALHRPPAELQPLVDLILAKTGGNPFFVGEFLKTLYTEKLLDFNLAQQRWCWQIHAIEAKGITGNVVELMLRKMTQLPPDTQSMLQLAACVGNRFELNLLARVAETSLFEVAHRLWPAPRDGLILQDDRDGHPGWVERTAPVSDRVPLLYSSKRCRFLHDRMLQAAYESMTVSHRQQTHLRIGRLWWNAGCVDELSDEERFAIVAQLNQARPWIHAPEEQAQLALLNLRAAQQAKASSAWEAVATYAGIGIELLSPDPWQRGPEAAQALYRLKAEADYLNGDPDSADRHYDELFLHLQDNLQRADICATRMVQALGHGEWAKGGDYGLQGLDYLGLGLPDEAQLAEAIRIEKTRLHERCPAGVIDNVLAMPEMQDPAMLIAMRILPNLYARFNVLNQSLYRQFACLKGANWLLAYGKSDVAAVMLAFYAAEMRRNCDFRGALQQAEQARLLADSYESCREIANFYNFLATCLWHLKAPLPEAVRLNMKGMRLGLERGELARAAMNYGNTLFSMFSQGEPLAGILQQAIDAEAFVAKHALYFPVSTVIRQLCTALLSEDSQGAGGLNDAQFEPGLFAKIKASFHYGYLLHYRCMLAFWYDNQDAALDWARQVEHSNLPINSSTIDHQFFYTLLLLQQWDHLGVEDRAKVNDLQQVFAELTSLYTPNFEHKQQLLAAERARAEGQATKAVCTLYRDAIASAKKHGFLAMQALGNELFGEYWLSEGFDSIALPFIREAICLYRQWGCQPRVLHLQTRFDHVLPEWDARVAEPVSLAASQVSHKSQPRDTLDLATVMKSAQLISSELLQSRLAAKVLEVIVESAGASSASLMITIAGQPQVIAQVGDDRQMIVPDAPMALELCLHLPQTIVRYVLNTDDVVNIGDVPGHRLFANDPYLMQHRPRSILCVPVVYRDRTVGALYLENKLTQDAFTPDRLDVIRLLLAQTAISFENAQLFEKVNQLNQSLEQKVEQRTLALNQAIKSLELANEELNSFSHSVSHDLRAPLRGISGFSQMLAEDYGDLLDADGKDLIARITRNVTMMQDLIEGLLTLSRVQRKALEKEPVDISAMVGELFAEMRERFPRQSVTASSISGCRVVGDKRMLYAALENLINNAWKYSSRTAQARVEFGVLNSAVTGIPAGIGARPESLPLDTPIYFVKDNGAGFDMARADKLFGSFQRLHGMSEFPGTGVGLATVKHVIEKHGGYVWAYAQPDEGAIFYFVL